MRILERQLGCSRSVGRYDAATRRDNCAAAPSEQLEELPATSGNSLWFARLRVAAIRLILRGDLMRTLLVALGALTFLASTGSAQAIDGSLRLHLEVPVLGYQSQEITPDGADDGASVSRVTVGPGTSTLGFGLGYGLSEMLVLGANVALQHTIVSPEEGASASTTAVQVLPYLEVLFGQGSARPFIGGNLMLQISSGENTDSTLFGLGALGGVHVFLNEWVSFDVSARVYYMTGTVTVDTAIVEAESDLSELGVLLLLGVSGWS